MIKLKSDVVLRLIRLATEAVVRRCESPIERALFAAIFRQGFLISSGDSAGAVSATHGTWGVELWQQYETTAGDRRCRLDIALLGGNVKIAVECDGHDFHERTPEQAERDRSRDRALTLEGWTVLRFTGREINRDAAACALQVMTAVGRFLDGGDGAPISDEMLEPPAIERAPISPETIAAMRARTAVAFAERPKF